MQADDKKVLMKLHTFIDFIIKYFAFAFLIQSFEMLIWFEIKHIKIPVPWKPVSLTGVLLTGTVFRLYWSTLNGIKFGFAKNFAVERVSYNNVLLYSY